MCSSPSVLYVPKAGEPGEVHRLRKACGRCRWCRVQYVNDYVGRCMAEAAMADTTSVVTLTYAPRDDLSDKVLTPKHFQNFMKRMRRAGHNVRYLVAGEYGELKGRAHFHAVLFFRGSRWQIEQKQRVWDNAWPHGHIYVDHDVGERGFRYVCKYLLKDSAKDTWKSQSKEPALGWDWFAAKADWHIANGVYPTTFEYFPPGAKGKTRYFMRGATRRDYLKRIREGLGDGYRDNAENLNEWVAKGYEAIDREEARQRERDEDPETVRQKMAHYVADKWLSERAVNRVLLDTNPEAARQRFEEARSKARSSDGQTT